jgi:hypothetical protein
MKLAVEEVRCLEFLVPSALAEHPANKRKRTPRRIRVL